MLRQMLRFGLVGALATLVHIIIGFLLIQSGWQPLTANVAAFATAFLVSFCGHLGFSFADEDVDPMTALWRFSLVAIAGFSVNEALLFGLLSRTTLSGTLALSLATGCAALFTFWLSRVWAFRSSDLRVDARTGTHGLN